MDAFDVIFKVCSATSLSVNGLEERKRKGRESEILVETKYLRSDEGDASAAIGGELRAAVSATRGT